MPMENRAIRAGYRAPWARCRTEGALRAMIPVSGQAGAGTALPAQPTGATARRRPGVSTLIRAHGLVCCRPSRRPMTIAAAPRCSSAQPSSSGADRAGSASGQSHDGADAGDAQQGGGSARAADPAAHRADWDGEVARCAGARTRGRRR
jgi:hypothetical protein